MAKDEKTSKRVGAIASKAIRGAPLTKPERKCVCSHADAASQGIEEEVAVASESLSIDRTQRAGIVMTPLACALSGSSTSPTF